MKFGIFLQSFGSAENTKKPNEENTIFNDSITQIMKPKCSFYGL